MKRRLAVIAVFLVLGAVVNVGVIWACQILIYDTSVYFYDSTLREIAPTPNAWPLDVPDSWPEPESARTAGTFWHDMEIHEATHRDDVPTPFLPGTTPSVTTRNWIVREYKWGLPFRSMRSTNAAHSDM